MVFTGSPFFFLSLSLTLSLSLSLLSCVSAIYQYLYLCVIDMSSLILTQSLLVDLFLPMFFILVLLYVLVEFWFSLSQFVCYYFASEIDRERERQRQRERERKKRQKNKTESRRKKDIDRERERQEERDKKETRRERQEERYKKREKKREREREREREGERDRGRELPRGASTHGFRPQRLEMCNCQESHQKTSRGNHFLKIVSKIAQTIV